MRLYIFLLIIFLNSQEKKSPLYIYEGKSFPFVVYFDNEKQEKIVEILGIKYGKLDFVDNVKSKEGYIYTKNNNLYYKNENLKINTKLIKKKYSYTIDNKRYKLFAINAFFEILSLKDSLGINDYIFNWEVKDDFLYYRDNNINYDEYIPNYIIHFYEHIKHTQNVFP